MIILNKKSLNFLSLRNKKLEIIENENHDLKNLNTQLKIRNNDLNFKFKNLLNDNENLNNQIVSLKEENKKFSDEILYLKRKIKQLTKEKKYDTLDFINFQEFLAKSYISPIVESPFVNEDKRVLAFMDHLGKKLRKNVMNNDYEPLVSIILSTNDNNYPIQQTIHSVLKQTYTNFELIIIEDGINKDTINPLIKDKRIKIFHDHPNKRSSQSRNIGLKNINGEIVMYLNSNNEWDSKFIETMVGAFIELHDADALYSGEYLYESPNSNPYAICFASYNKPLLHNHNFIDLNCFCHKRHILNKIKGFDENLDELSDWDFILKISNYFKIYSVPVILSKHHNYNSKDNNSELSLNYVKNTQKMLNKNKIPMKKYYPLNRKISIIIPSYESLNELKCCINSILSNESIKLIDIIVIDNNSSIDVKEYLINLESKSQIKLISNNINYGFSFAINQGINLADKDSDILILNNDAILTKGSLEHMQHCAYSIPKCGLVVPHEILFEETETISKHVPFAYNNFKCDTTPSKLHHNIINMPLFHDGGLLELNFAPFFCTYIKREVYNKTEGLDPELGRHYRSDRIFSDFIRHFLKLKIYQSPHAFVYHKNQVATKKLKETKIEEYEYIYGKNQWEPNLAEKLGFEKSIWDY